jgi:hypothetical protein
MMYLLSKLLIAGLAGIGIFGSLTLIAILLVYLRFLSWCRASGDRAGSAEGEPPKSELL